MSTQGQFVRPKTGRGQGSLPVKKLVVQRRATRHTTDVMDRVEVVTDREQKQRRWTSVLILLLLVPAVIATEGTVPENGPVPVKQTGTDEQQIKIQFEPFMELCKGTYERPVEFTSLLFCWNDVRNYYGELAPTKVELLNFDPLIILLHGVIHDGEIAQLMRLGESTIKVSGPTNDSWLPVYYDNHQTYTLHDRDHPVVESLTRRIEQLTGLSCDSAEDLKVIYNEVGAYKTSDIDVIQSEADQLRFAYSGNRLATVLFFLNDVVEGGRFIFPKMRVSIQPQKGTALMWYNLKDTGLGNEYARYSVCPLQQEVKWTAKKIIHTRGNELRNPCKPRRAESESTSASN